MTDTASPANLDFEEQRARIRQALDESDKRAAERTKLVAKQAKLAAEQTKLTAETLKFERECSLGPWQIAFSSMAAGAALFGVGAAFVKLMGS